MCHPRHARGKQFIRVGHQLLRVVATPYRMPAAVLSDLPKRLSIDGSGAPCGGSNRRRISSGQGAAASADRRAPPIAGARTVEGVLVAARPAASGALTTQVKLRLASLEHGFDRLCSRRSESPSPRLFPDPDDDRTTQVGDRLGQISATYGIHCRYIRHGRQERDIGGTTERASLRPCA